jgi:hypothetical protein
MSRRVLFNSLVPSVLYHISPGTKGNTAVRIRLEHNQIVLLVTDDDGDVV